MLGGGCQYWGFWVFEGCVYGWVGRPLTRRGWWRKRNKWGVEVGKWAVMGIKMSGLIVLPWAQRGLGSRGYEILRCAQDDRCAGGMTGVGARDDRCGCAR